MFGFKSKEDIKREVIDELREEEERRKQEIAEAEEKARVEERERVAAEEKAREDEAAKMKASDEPWVIIKAMVPDTKKGIKVELDWNDAFIKHLRANGYTGPDDDTVIQRYVAVLSKQVAEDMADDMVNENE